MDLVQLRWQQIRAAESSLFVQKENVELKREIAGLKRELAESRSQASPGVAPELLRSISSRLVGFVMKEKSELVRIRLSVQSQVEFWASSSKTMRAALARFERILEERNERIESLRKESAQHSSELLAMKKEVEHLRAKLELEQAQSNRDKGAQLEELERLRVVVSEQTMKIKHFEKTTEEMRVDRVALEKSLAEKEKLVSMLREDVKLLEERYQQAFKDAQESQFKMNEHYQRIISELGQENQNLRSHVKDLEEQIARLSAALVGNKSHFAKYVEVKSENMELRSKLDAVLRKKSRFQGVELSRDTNAVNSGDSILPQIPSAGRQDKNKLNALNKGRVVI